MSLQSEIESLHAVIRDPDATREQIQTAQTAIDKLTRRTVQDALARMEARGQQYDQLVQRLSGVVADIKANRFSNALGEVDDVVDQIGRVADAAGGGEQS